mgnify:CR=1 FL=1
MEKEEIKKDNQKNLEKDIVNDKDKSEEAKNEQTEKELTPEDKIKELEDKVVRSYAEMENQRRRYEKEKDDAFDYGGFSFAKESLNSVSYTHLTLPTT